MLVYVIEGAFIARSQCRYFSFQFIPFHTAPHLYNRRRPAFCWRSAKILQKKYTLSVRVCQLLKGKRMPPILAGKAVFFMFKRLRFLPVFFVGIVSRLCFFTASEGSVFHATIVRDGMLHCKKQRGAPFRRAALPVPCPYAAGQGRIRPRSEHAPRAKIYRWIIQLSGTSHGLCFLIEP